MRKRYRCGRFVGLLWLFRTSRDRHTSSKQVGVKLVKEDKREEKLGWRDGAGLRTRFSSERHESNQGVLTSWTADDGGTTLRFLSNSERSTQYIALAVYAVRRVPYAVGPRES